ncbi:S1/P1 nuclease [Anaeromyxobacter terrae]|uniref:S1/P1 nuclease n=1 Tax=Anaeromyxobacter terrae TaxID=2925406 RepID=UPI001F55B97F|nr:S1/P1 nuclease [Anaeromyxobacter sp. SG22]
MTRTPAALPLLSLAAALAATPFPADAWSAQGHRVAAAIAEERLTPAARRLVRELLGATPMSDVAGWADAQRDPATRPWHYVNIPPEAAGYERERDCPRDACVVAALERAIAELSGGDAAVRRADAFRWLVHLVADLHQPLHADGRERGGTELETRRARGGRKTRSLHRVWDEDVLQPILYRRGAIAAGRALAREVSAGDAARAAAELSPAAWANESHALARALYAELGPPPRGGRVLVLPDAYAAMQRAQVEAQLQKAGVRLAALLDRIAVAREARARPR